MRRKKGLTLDEVAERMTCSTSKISRLETGKGVPKIPDVSELMRIYGVTSETERDMLLRLVHDGREQGWWEQLTEGLAHERLVGDPSARYAGLESAALTVDAFELVLVHGLLQTARYTRTILESLIDIEEDEIERLLELRRRRQDVLARRDPPLRLSVVLDESVLARAAGSPEIMVEQLDHLAEMTRLPNVTVRILPFTTGMHRGAYGPFGGAGLSPGERIRPGLPRGSHGGPVPGDRGRCASLPPRSGGSRPPGARSPRIAIGDSSLAEHPRVSAGRYRGVTEFRISSYCATGGCVEVGMHPTAPSRCATARTRPGPRHWPSPRRSGPPSSRV